MMYQVSCGAARAAVCSGLLDSGYHSTPVREVRLDDVDLCHAALMKSYKKNFPPHDLVAIFESLEGAKKAEADARARGRRAPRKG